MHCTELAVVPDTAQDQKSLPLLSLYFLTKIHHACVHLTHGGQVPMEGAMLQRLRQTLPSTAVVTCHSPLLCFLLLFVTWPFSVIPGSSVSLLCSLKWDQAKGSSLGSTILDITFSRCLVLDKQARLENVDFQFWPCYPVRLPL